MKLDLSSLKSVKQFAKQLAETEPKVDILINNAAIAGIPKCKPKMALKWVSGQTIWVLFHNSNKKIYNNKPEN